MRAIIVFGLLGLTFVGSVSGGDAPPAMKFNEVKEIAPGVFFRYSSISATDKTIPFGGSNNIWIVFEDYVLVYDANFPDGAEQVVKEIRKTTNKPIRYVLDSHHHGDHAYGNAVFAEAGATIIASANTARLLRTNGPEEFAKAGKGPAGRKDVANSYLKVPSLVFDDKLILDDGKQRAELYFLGHAHTAGDAMLYLPKHKILCTGDACVNGAFNFMGHSDSASWVRVLDQAEQFDVKWVCPGHGAMATRELLAKQKRYFVELRKHVYNSLESGKELDEIIKSVDFPWYKEWTGVKPAVDNIKHVFAEFTGQIMPWDFIEDFGIYEGPSPTKDTPGWTKPKKIVIPNLMPAKLAELKRVAPEILFVPVKTVKEAVKEAADADAVIGFNSADIVKAGKKLRWIQTGAAGVEKDLTPELKASNIVLTNTQKIYGPNVADQAMALLLCVTRGMSKGFQTDSQSGKTAGDLLRRWNWLKSDVKPQELHGKTMMIVGLGGIGTQIARRAHGFGMRVMGIDPNEKMQKPDFVFSLNRPAQMMELLPKADVVVIACPLTEKTKGMFGASQFGAMKSSAYFINIARGEIVNTPDLVAALKADKIAGAGLDVTDPEPLPSNHSLWQMPNVAISPHLGGQSPEARQDRQWRLWRENLRRFVAGEPLLCVVDKAKGY